MTLTALPGTHTVKYMLAVIKDLAADGMTCILVAHEMGCAR